MILGGCIQQQNPVKKSPYNISVSVSGEYIILNIEGPPQDLTAVLSNPSGATIDIAYIDHVLLLDGHETIGLYLGEYPIPGTYHIYVADNKSSVIYHTVWTFTGPKLKITNVSYEQGFLTDLAITIANVGDLPIEITKIHLKIGAINKTFTCYETIKPNSETTIIETLSGDVVLNPKQTIEIYSHSLKVLTQDFEFNGPKISAQLLKIKRNEWGNNIVWIKITNTGDLPARMDKIEIKSGGETYTDVLTLFNCGVINPSEAKVCQYFPDIKLSKKITVNFYSNQVKVLTLVADVDKYLE